MFFSYSFLIFLHIEKIKLSHERVVSDKLGFAVWEPHSLLTVLLHLWSLAQSCLVYSFAYSVAFFGQLFNDNLMYVPLCEHLAMRYLKKIIDVEISVSL
jgi:hypothetical protein